MNLKSMILGFIFLILLSVLSGCTSNNSNNGTDDASWIQNYTPVHSLGTGPDDFWIKYPSGNPLSGQDVDHFSWIVDSLKSKPVLFVVHRTGCVGCADQAERVIELGKKYNENVKFYDLDAVYDASNDIIQKANEVYMYDPNGPPGYIALTGVFTYVEDNGEIKIGWHSWELDVEDSVMESWLKDAIYYYNIINK